MNAAAKVAFGETAGDYSRFRAGFPDAFFDRAATVGVGLRGQRILDLGTGTGTLARGFAARGAAVTGLDPDGRMLAAARQLDTQAGVSADYVEAPAETTGQPDGAFDVVTAGQCWHWFDRPAAAAECRRILKPGGTLMIAHFDWLPIGDEQGGNVVAATEALIREHNPSWTMHGGTGLYPAWLTDLAEAGFEDIESFTFDVAQPYSHDAWRGRIRASAGVGASLDPDAVDRFDAELTALLAADFPHDPLSVPHRVFAAYGRTPDAV